LATTTTAETTTTTTACGLIAARIYSLTVGISRSACNTACADSIKSVLSTTTTWSGRSPALGSAATTTASGGC
jgi:hypothetical protein